MKELNEIDTNDNSTLDSLIEGFQLISFDWRYLYVNSSFVEQSKMNTKKDLLGFTMMEKFPGIEKTEWFKDVRECMTSRISKTIDIEYSFPDNSKGYFELRIEPVPKGIFILSMDITERKKSEASFRESEEKYRLFFEHNLDAIFLTAPDGSILNANPEAIRLFGYSLEELRQKGRGAIVDVNDPKLHSALLERKKTGKFRGELILIRKDGIKLLCEISTVIYKNSDGLDRTHMIIKDITEKKKSEEKLKESSERFKYATLASNEIIYDWDIINNTLWWNDSYYKLIGVENENKLLGLDSWTKFIHPEDHDQLFKSVTDFLEGKEGHWNGEYRFIGKNNDIHYFSDRGFLIRDDLGKPLRMIGAATDISSWKENIKNLEEILFSLSHKVRQPVANILGISNLLENELIDTNELKKIANHMRESANSLDKFTKELNNHVWSSKQKVENKNWA